MSKLQFRCRGFILLTKQKKQFSWAAGAAQAAGNHRDGYSRPDIYDKEYVYQFQTGPTHKIHHYQ